MKSVRIKKPQLMPVASNDAQTLQRTLNSVIEAIQPLVGQNPNKLETAVTFADLHDSGFELSGFFNGVQGGSTIVVPPQPRPDPVVPPTVKNFKAAATWDMAVLTWDASGYKRHAYVEIFRAEGFKDEANTIPTSVADAVFVGLSDTTGMGDNVISNHHYRYWARNVSQDGLRSDWHSQEGTHVFAPRSPSEYISIISGEIKKDDLYITLGQEIDKIPVLETGLAALDVRVGQNAAAISTQSTQISDLESAQASLTTQVAANTTGLTNANQTIASNTAAITQHSQAITTLESTTATHTTQISSVTSKADANGTKIGENTALITTQGQAITSLESAQATLTTQVSTNTATIQQHYSVTEQHGQLINAAYTVKIDTGSVITGFGLMTDAAGNSRFAVRADRFYVAPPTKSNAQLTDADIPFIIDGNNTLIKNAYIDTAYIETLVTGDLVANRITGETVTGLHIRGGDISIGNNFTVNGAGDVVATNAFLEGEIHADKGTLNNVVINENCTIKGIMEASQIRGDVVNHKRVACPANGYWYQQKVEGDDPRFPYTKVVTIKFQPWTTARRVTVTNLKIGVLASIITVGSAWGGRVQCRSKNGDVIKSWPLARNTAVGVRSVLLIGQSIAVGTNSTMKFDFLLPAGETEAQFWVTVSAHAGGGDKTLTFGAAIMQPLMIGMDSPNFYGEFADVEYISDSASPGVVII